MHDLKFYARSDNDLKSLLEIVKDFSDDNGIEFGLDKFDKAMFKADKFVKSSNIVPDINIFIRNLE